MAFSNLGAGPVVTSGEYQFEWYPQDTPPTTPDIKIKWTKINDVVTLEIPGFDAVNGASSDISISIPREICPEVYNTAQGYGRFYRGTLVSGVTYQLIMYVDPADPYITFNHNWGAGDPMQLLPVTLVYHMTWT